MARGSSRDDRNKKKEMTVAGREKGVAGCRVFPA
jgi:hypothetical protein